VASCSSWPSAPRDRTPRKDLASRSIATRSVASELQAEVDPLPGAYPADWSTCRPQTLLRSRRSLRRGRSRPPLMAPLISRWWPRGCHRVAAVLRPASCPRPAGVSPVRVGTGAPGSRPRFVVERRRAERGVESLFGGSKIAGRSAYYASTILLWETFPRGPSRPPSSTPRPSTRPRPPPSTSSSRPRSAPGSGSGSPASRSAHAPRTPPTSAGSSAGWPARSPRTVAPRTWPRSRARPLPGTRGRSPTPARHPRRGRGACRPSPRCTGTPPTRGT
jgi:hypothetical protein